MKVTFLTCLAIATAAVANPVAAMKQSVKRDDIDPQTALTDLTATVKTHTANISMSTTNRLGRPPLLFFLEVHITDHVPFPTIFSRQDSCYSS